MTTKAKKYEALGRALRAAREAAGLSTSDVANDCGVSANCISKWERGLNRPGPKHAASLGAVFPELVSTLTRALAEPPKAVDRSPNRPAKARPKRPQRARQASYRIDYPQPPEGAPEPGGEAAEHPRRSTVRAWIEMAKRVRRSAEADAILALLLFAADEGMSAAEVLEGLR
jgi:transcriptional regulator with XRE-family HTH domain